MANISVTGYIIEGDKIIRDKALVDYFSNIDTVIEFKNRLINANGQFSVIVDNKEEIWLACDRVRNYPVFYTQNHAENIISDDCYICLKEKSNAQINSIAGDAFLAVGYVPNNLTLIDDIFQVEAGSFVTLGQKVSITFYHNTINTPVTDIDPDTGKRRLRDLLESVFSDQMNAVKNKYIAISLSGGYDSRFIALMAKKYHPENLLCFSYGRRNNPEVIRAQRVSKIIDAKWINIEYNSELIRGFLNEEIFHEYYPYASNLTSMFYMQDYFAVKYLKEKNIVPDDCLFIPGHTGGITGSHLNTGMYKINSVNKITESIYKTHFYYIRLPNDKKDAIIDLIRKRTPILSTNAWKTFENWNLKERQAKFVINSAKVYKCFGYDYLMPLLDNSIIDFFASLPLQLKTNKKLYHDTLEVLYFNDIKLNFPDDLHISSIKKRYQRIKDFVKPFLPYDLVTMLTNQKNIVLYDEITKEFRKNMGAENVIHPVQANLFNSYLIQWYLFKTREYLKSLYE